MKNLNCISILVTDGLMCFVSIRRINKYLSSDELEDKENNKGNDTNYPIKMENSYFAWDENSKENKCALKDVNIKIEKQSLTVVVGAGNILFYKKI